MNYIWLLLFMVGLYLPLAYSLNLILGFGGLASFCHAAFYGIGAYAYALSVTVAGLPAIAALGATAVSTALVAACVGSICLRFRGDLFIFVTISVQMISFVILYNWIDLTNGPYGISGIPRPELFGVVLHTPIQFVLAVFLANAVMLPMLFMIYRSPFGLTLKALRDNEVAGASLGINPNAAYLKAFVISAVFAAIPGAFYAAYVTYIDPTSFTLRESIFLVAILLLGGAGNRTGPFLGVIVILLIPEGLRFVGLPDPIAPNVREIVYGLLLATLMYFRPQGIAGDFAIR
jgi:branched-chain amino acid transport system permease protein